MDHICERLIEAVKNDLTPSLGVTEPGAIAYAAACAARALGGRIDRVSVRLNSGIYKNSFTCAVPGTDGMGCALAAALGAIAGDPERKLMATETASNEDAALAKKMVVEGRAEAILAEISPEVFIEASVTGELGSASAEVSGRHDRLVSLIVNGKTVYSKSGSDSEAEGFRVSSASFSDILECVETAEGLEFLDNAVDMDLELYGEGARKSLMPLTEARCGNGRISMPSARLCAERSTCGAIEARVRGAAAPAMAITGSGSHGILCTLPVYETAAFYGIPQREGGRITLRRALLLSALTTMYIKEHSGLLSTACGCVLAGGTGAALGVTYLYAKTCSETDPLFDFARRPAPDRDELYSMLFRALNSMAASVTGMVCHGGNTGCSLKAAIGVDMAFSAAEMAIKGSGAESIHGILGSTPEQTMRNMGRVAADMLPVEKTIIDIMSCKAGKILI